ncbi:MAG: SiaB family protein kinase [Bacteroidales bacterium]|nr:SiaB family protein kinase [Bacteroidales bacterium]
MKNYDIVINHRGIVDLNVINYILHELKGYIKHKVKNKIIRKRIYTLSVECLENIYKHSDLNTKKDSLTLNYPPRFIIEKITDDYIIHIGNIILNSNINTVLAKIETLNKLNQDEINELYKNSLSDGKISSKGGAGLGLIVMAKTTGQKIKYDFEKINDKFSYFAMQLVVKSDYLI